MGKADRGRAKLADARSFVARVYGDELHAKRIASLAGATPLRVQRERRWQSPGAAIRVPGMAPASARPA